MSRRELPTSILQHLTQSLISQTNLPKRLLPTPFLWPMTMEMQTLARKMESQLEIVQEGE